MARALTKDRAFIDLIGPARRIKDQGAPSRARAFRDELLDQKRLLAHAHAAATRQKPAWPAKNNRCRVVGRFIIS